MAEDRHSRTPLKPVPGVTWRSHMGCGALFGFLAGFIGALKEAITDGLLVPVLFGVAGAIVAGCLAAFLGNKFWLR